MVAFIGAPSPTVKVILLLLSHFLHALLHCLPHCLLFFICHGLFELLFLVSAVCLALRPPPGLCPGIRSAIPEVLSCGRAFEKALQDMCGGGALFDLQNLDPELLCPEHLNPELLGPGLNPASLGPDILDPEMATPMDSGLRTSRPGAQSSSNMGP